jgi:hypothetical protein
MSRLAFESWIGWFAEYGLIEVAQKRCKRIAAFKPKKPGRAG